MNLPTLQSNRRVCARCPYSQRPCAGGCICVQSGRDIREHQREGFCPMNMFPPPLPDGAELPPVPETRRADGSPCGSPERWGPVFWEKFHAAAGSGTLTPEWLSRFVALIPCPGCQADFRAWAEANPPPWGRDLRPWTVDAHNAVSAKLDPPKPAMSYEEAARRWGWTQGGA